VGDWGEVEFRGAGGMAAFPTGALKLVVCQRPEFA
jgi:hypothetical protein